MDQQGPYNRSCVITANNEDLKEGTCSGILIDTKTGFILTHASLLSPLLDKTSLVLKDIKFNSYSADRQEVQNLNVEVILQPRSTANGPNLENTKRFQPNLLNNNLEETNVTDKFRASILCVFRSPSLKNALRKLVPSGNWEFVEDLSDSSNKNSNKNKQDQAENSIYYDLLPCFILLRLHDWFGYKSYLPYKTALENKIGDSVEINSTPFGGLNPEVFLNSKSQGIISNIAGKKQVLIMVDARCIPGSEGGALYCTHGKIRLLTGIIIATLCWKNNEWIGLSLACAISEILNNLSQLPLDLPEIESNMFKQVELQWKQKPFIHEISTAIKFLSVGSNWGSGVIFTQQSDGKHLMLTCSHVVRGSEHRPVKIRNEMEDTKTVEVIYKTPIGNHFDLALLSVCYNSNTDINRYIDLHIGTVEEGEPVFVIGHAIFGEDLDLEPTVTRGVVSKVITVSSVPIMIQTTCAVHAGASGGAVVNMNGHLVGIVVCNAKDTTTGASFPHVNMCVPVATVSRVLEEYKSTSDKGVLKQLHIKNPVVKRLWTLGTANTDALMTVPSKL